MGFKLDNEKLLILTVEDLARDLVKIVVWREMFFKNPHRRFTGIFLALCRIMHGQNHFFRFANTIKRLESFNAKDAPEAGQEALFSIEIGTEDINHFFFWQKCREAGKEEYAFWTSIAPVVFA